MAEQVSGAQRLVIKIADEVIERREIRGRNGNFTAESQYGIADLPNGERRKVRVRVSRERGPYAPGLYTISDLSFGVGEWGDFTIADLHLVPVSRPSAASGSGSSQSGAAPRVGV